MCLESTIRAGAQEVGIVSLLGSVQSSIPTYPHQCSPGIEFNEVGRRFAFYLSRLNHTVAIPS